jgi:chromate transporter
MELALIFLRLGITAFGGPAAHIAMMRVEFVERRQWLTETEFLDLVGTSNLLPGPGSTELAIFIGRRRAGWVGLILAGVCFILPAALIVYVFAWAYVRFRHLPQLANILYGVKPVIIAVVAQALWTLGRAALRTRLLTLVGVAALSLCFLGAAPVAVSFGSGAVLGVRAWFHDGPVRMARTLILLLGVVALLVGLPIVPTAFDPPTNGAVGLAPLLLIFLKVGTAVYGSGYVLLAFLRADFVTRLHWLTPTQLLDSVAVGQLTPGPVFTTATFIGYLLAGPWGALGATVGIFLPAFVLVACSGPLVPRIRRSPMAGAFLDGANVAAVALIAFAEWQLGRAALIDSLTVTLAFAAALLLFRWRINSAWLALGGGALGLILRH